MNKDQAIRKIVEILQNSPGIGLFDVEIAEKIWRYVIEPAILDEADQWISLSKLDSSNPN